MDEQKEKKIDESWKETVEKEKHKEPQPQGQEQPDKETQIPEVNFFNFVSSLSLQTLISLGEVENPFTSQKELNLAQAKFLIDTLDMLKEKTLGNLNDDESRLLESILYELKMKYVAKNKESVK